MDACTRIAELAWWWPRVLDRVSRNRMHLEIKSALGNGVLLQVELAEAEPTTLRESELEIERNILQIEMATLQHSHSWTESELASERDTLRMEIDALRRSQSWKVTAPLRLLSRWIRGR